MFILWHSKLFGVNFRNAIVSWNGIRLKQIVLNGNQDTKIKPIFSIINHCHMTEQKFRIKIASMLRRVLRTVRATTSSFDTM